MLIFSVNGTWEPTHTKTENTKEYFFAKMVQQLTEKFPHIASVFFLENIGRADIVQ